MKLVKWSCWPTVGPVETGKCPLDKLEKKIQEYEQEAKRVLEETGADHVVYAAKYYDYDGELKEVRFYMIPMSDERLEGVVSNPDIRVYALHKMK